MPARLKPPRVLIGETFLKGRRGALQIHCVLDFVLVAKRRTLVRVVDVIQPGARQLPRPGLDFVQEANVSLISDFAASDLLTAHVTILARAGGL